MKNDYETKPYVDWKSQLQLEDLDLLPFLYCKKRDNQNTVRRPTYEIQ